MKKNQLLIERAFFVRTVGINVNLASTQDLDKILRHCF